MMPTKDYRKRPIRVSTLEWNGENLKEMQLFTAGHFRRATGTPGPITGEVFDRLHSTWIGVKTGDLVIQGVMGEFYPHDKEAMNRSYRPATNEQEFSALMIIKHTRFVALLVLILAIYGIDWLIGGIDPGKLDRFYGAFGMLVPVYILAWCDTKDWGWLIGREKKPK